MPRHAGCVTGSIAAAAQHRFERQANPAPLLGTGAALRGVQLLRCATSAACSPPDPADLPLSSRLITATAGHQAGEWDFSPGISSSTESEGKSVPQLQIVSTVWTCRALKA